MRYGAYCERLYGFLVKSLLLSKYEVVREVCVVSLFELLSPHHQIVDYLVYLCLVGRQCSQHRCAVCHLVLSVFHRYTQHVCFYHGDSYRG